MPTRRSATAAALLCAATVVPLTAQAQLGVQRERNAPDAYAITNARIVPVSGPAIDRGTIVIRNGIIAAVGASVSVPADARTVDGSGLTVYPGFIESYSSLGIPAPRSTGGGGGGGAGAFLAAQQQQPSGPTAPSSTRPAGQQPELSPADYLNPDAESFTQAQAAGFTAALTAPGSGIFAGQSAVIELRDGSTQEILLRTPVALHVGFTSGRGFGGGYPNSLMGVFAVLRQSLLDAQHYAAEHAAYAANPRSGMARPQHDASLAALQPVLQRQMSVVMVANSQREIERALDLAREFNLRAMIAGGQEAHLVATRLRAESVPVLLSMNFPRPPTNRSADADPEPLRVLRARVEAPRTPAALMDGGVRLALHAGGGYTEFVGNLQRAVENGLSRDQAIRALTIVPAELFGVADRVGTIEQGKVANLTLVRGDLFAREGRVTQIFVNGQPVDLPAPAAGRDAPAAPTLTGTWTTTVTLEGADRPVTIQLRQTGEQLRGTLQGELGTSQIPTGTIDAEGEFRFTTSVTLPDGTEEAVFTGTLSGNTIRGGITIVGHARGTFVGTRPAPDGAGEQGAGPRGRRPQQPPPR